MVRVLILHHVEPYWEEALRSKGTSFEDMAIKAVRHIKKKRYDRVILTQFEGYRPTLAHYDTGLAKVVTEWQEYGYGWEFPQDEDAEYLGHSLYLLHDQLWTDNTRGHSDFVLIPEWVQELKNDKVFLAGAFDGECIADMQDALDAAGVRYTRVEELIVG